MLKVIDSKIVSKIQIDIDDYVPLSFRCLDTEIQSFLYWITGNFKTSLLEIGINPNDGSLLKLKMPLAGKIHQISDNDQIEKIKALPSTKGLPIVEINDLIVNHVNDEQSEIIVSIGSDGLIIQLKEDVMINKIFCIDNAKFGIDSNKNLVLLAFFDISKSNLQKVK